MPVPLSAPIFKKEDLQGENLDFFNQWVATVVQSLNAQLGSAGPVKLSGHLYLQGNRVMNVGDPVASTDAVSHAVAASQFGADALRPQIESLGKSILQTSRRLNDKVQRENFSSFLNSIVNTAPTTNTSLVSFGAPSGGTVAVTISAGFHQKVDGSQVSYAGRTDVLSLPTPFTIVSIVRSGNEVTIQTSAANPFVAGETVAVTGVTDTSFNGSFTIDAIVDTTHFTYPQFAANATSSGGTVSLGGVFYYYLKKDMNTLGLSNNVFGSGDNWQARLKASFDGQTIIAVVALGGGGGDLTNSAAGATDPVSSANVHIFGRL